MRIEGVTCCVGEEYAGHLARSLPVWLDTLDSLTIIMQPGFRLGADVEPPWRARCSALYTDAFTANGAHFNKGAALNEGIAAAKPTDWLLSFDCDIIPPANWREVAEPLIEPGYLYGARRYSPEGAPVDRHWYPRGYFQLWHVSDPSYRRSPIFDDHLPDAGGYDTTFADQWPVSGWRELPIELVHQGKAARNWCGPDATEAQNREAVKRAVERQRVRRATT